MYYLSFSRLRGRSRRRRRRYRRLPIVCIFELISSSARRAAVGYGWLASLLDGRRGSIVEWNAQRLIYSLTHSLARSLALYQSTPSRSLSIGRPMHREAAKERETLTLARSLTLLSLKSVSCLRLLACSVSVALTETMMGIDRLTD